MDDRLLDGARAAFCKKGVANTSVEEIAAQIGVSKHTIYRRYPNKGTLLEAVVERDITRFRDALSSPSGFAKNPLEAVEMAARRYFEIGSSRDYAAFYLSVMAEAAISTTLRSQLVLWSKASLEPLEQVHDFPILTGFPSGSNSAIPSLSDDGGRDGARLQPGFA